MPPQNTIAVNTPSIIAGNGSTGVTLLAANTARRGLTVQNVGTTTAYILIGGVATSTVYHFAVKGGTGNGDGLGGSITLPMAGCPCPSGIVTMYGASSALCTCLEIAP